MSNNIFGCFPQYLLWNNVSQTKPPAIKVSEITNISADTNKKGKKNKRILFGSTIASLIIAAGIFGITFGKGLHGSHITKLTQYAERLSVEIKDIEATKKFSKKIPLYFKKGIKKVIDLLQASSNFTAIKDAASDSALKSNKLTKKFAIKSKEGFQHIVDKTLGKKYHKADINVNDFTSLLKQYKITSLSNLDNAQKLKKIKIKDTTKTLEEWIKILSEQTQNLESAYSEGFSLGARKIRAQKRSRLLSDISQKVKERFFNKKGLFNLKNYKTYVTEDVSKSAKTELSKDITNARKLVTNNIEQIQTGLKSKLNAFKELINPKDNKSIDTITQIGKKLEAYKSCAGAREVKDRRKIIKDISVLIDNASAVLKSNKMYSEKEQAQLIKYLQEIKNAMVSAGETKKGSLEEIMTIIKGLKEKKLISGAELKEYEKLAKNIRKNLNKATNLEMGEYFLKQAELEVGSAPTDVLSVLFPIGAGAYAISKADNKEEKVSATLTTCIPLIGTFATFVYGTTKMLSGAKNLVFSLVSGIILNKAGNYCDRLYKNYKKSGSIVKVAEDEYNKFWTEITPKYAQPLNEK